MTTSDVSVKVITEVKTKSGMFSIHCFADRNEDGSTTPTIFKAQILQEPTIVDNVSGKEGELIMSFSKGQSAGALTGGVLTIEPEDDDAARYERGGIDNADLIYNR